MLWCEFKPSITTPKEDLSSQPPYTWPHEIKCLQAAVLPIFCFLCLKHALPIVPHQAPVTSGPLPGEPDGPLRQSPNKCHFWAGFKATAPMELGSGSLRGMPSPPAPLTAPRLFTWLTPSKCSLQMSPLLRGHP